MTTKLLLNQARNTESDMSSITMPVEVNTHKEIIVDDNFENNVNEYNVYLDEREVCNIIRLSATVNLMASNIIFNSVTEIVKSEGSSGCTRLNFEEVQVGSTVGKSPDYKWCSNGINDAIEDTQLSYDGEPDKNYTYLCGIDIFNNHIMRSKTSLVSPWGNKELVTYNTISEVVVDIFQEEIKQNINEQIFISVTTKDGQIKSINKNLYRYNKKNIETFSESLNLNLVNNNGWVGFLNKSLMKTLDYDNKYLGTERVINNIRANRFVDLFPGRDRYEFLPHYNEYRDRYEKNWEYCLTYPSESTTDNIPFINSRLNTLKIAFINETEHDDDGIYRCMVYTVSKHGLMAGDTINMYRSTEDGEHNELLEGELIVDEIVDDYVFTVYTSDWVCTKWLSVFDEEGLKEYKIKHIGGLIYVKTEGENSKRLTSVNNYLNADFDEDGHIGAQNLSFAKVVNGVQCKYYVRIFSRLPNFEFYEGELTEENIYSTTPSGGTFVDLYSKLEYERQSTVSRQGFSKNIYGDNICQLVYNDDIDISLLHDNLGRPLTSIFLSIFKTNYGYKEWYGKKPDGYKSEEVEWSRCFGKLNCGFEYSPYIDFESFNTGNIFTMNNVEDDERGLTEVPLGGGRAVSSKTGVDYDEISYVDDDEIFYKQQDKFYGDLCMYSPSECLETVIQEACNRFNTAQRELSGKEKIFAATSFHPVQYSEILHDGYEDVTQLFTVTNFIYDQNPTAHPGGYYYYPHHEIPIKTFSKRLYEFTPSMIDVSTISIVEGRLEDNIYEIATAKENNFDMDSNLYIYDTLSGTSYVATLQHILSLNIIECKIIDNIDTEDPQRYKIYRKNVFIPDYAELNQETYDAYRWREIIPNGFDDEDGTIQEYPFVNGCLYVNANINLYLKRQDPFGDYGLSVQDVYFGLPQITGVKDPVVVDGLGSSGDDDSGTATGTNIRIGNIKDAIKESDVKC